MSNRSGTGCTVTFSGTDYDANITSITGLDGTVEVIDVSHLGTTGARAKILGDLKNWGTLDCEILVDPNKLDTMKTALGETQTTVTLTFKLVSGETTAATATFPGGISQHGISVPLEDALAGNYSIAVLGDITFTDAS